MPARPGSRDSCGPEVLDHHFLVAQHFVDVQRDALRRAADHHHRLRAPGRAAAPARLQQRAEPEEGQHLVAAARRRRWHRTASISSPRHAPHHLDQRRRHGDAQLAAAQHHHLRHRGGQRQHQAEAGALAGGGGGLDAPAHGVDLGAHHVHADAAAGQLGHAVGGAEAGREDQVGQFGIAGLRIGRQQAQGHARARGCAPGSARRRRRGTRRRLRCLPAPGRC